jgi:hypothetical protein
VFERPHTESAAKAYRVLGVFLYMVGAGLILECAAFWLGGLVMLTGVAGWIRGARLGRGVRRVSAGLQPRVEPATHPTEGRL